MRARAGVFPAGLRAAGSFVKGRCFVSQQQPRPQQAAQQVPRPQKLGAGMVRQMVARGASELAQGLGLQGHTQDHGIHGHPAARGGHGR